MRKCWLKDEYPANKDACAFSQIMWGIKAIKARDNICLAVFILVGQKPKLTILEPPAGIEPAYVVYKTTALPLS